MTAPWGTTAITRLLVTRVLVKTLDGEPRLGASPWWSSPYWSDAIAEVDGAVSRCPDFLHSAPPPHTEVGIGETLQPLDIRGGLPGTIAFADRVTRPGYPTRTEYIAYQPCGDYLSGLYVSGSDARTMLDALVPVSAAKLCTSDGAPRSASG